MIWVAHTNASANLRSWPGIPKAGEASNIVFHIAPGECVITVDVREFYDGLRVWCYVTGRHFHGWMSRELLLR